MLGRLVSAAPRRLLAGSALVFVLLGVLTTSIVYRMTKRPEGGDR